MRNRFTLLFLPLLIACAAMVNAQAQPDRPSALQAAVEMLKYKEVKADLKLSTTQATKIQSLRDKAYKMMQEMGQRSKPPTQAEAAALGKNMRKMLDDVIAVLTTAQQTRLRQLGMQRYGIFSIVAKDVKGLVGLTAAQETKIRNIQEDANKKVQDLIQQRQLQLKAVPQPKNPNDKAQVEAYQKKVRQLAESFQAQDEKTISGWQKSAESQALGTLSAAQKTKWQQIQGPKFNFNKLTVG